MDIIKADQLADLFSAISRTFDEAKEKLCSMDAFLGDGDLGLTMSKGFAAVPDAINDELSASGDIAKAIIKGGMKMSSVSPSTMGFLVSSGIMEAGKSLKGASEIGAAELAGFLNGFAEGIQKRGKCELGQCTVYDSVKPAADAAINAANNSNNLKDAANAAEKASLDGVNATKEMTPVFGKAAVHASNSSGIEDQGAVVGYLFIKSINKFIEEN